MIKTSPKLLLVLTLKFICGFLIIMLMGDYLEANKFYIDAAKLYETFVQPQQAGMGTESSFVNMANVMRWATLGLGASFDNLYVLFIAAYVGLFIHMVHSQKAYRSRLALLFIVLFPFDMIFFFQPNKEILSLAVNFIILKAACSENPLKITAALLAAVIYGIFFRQYYLIIVLLFVLFIIMKKVRSRALSAVLIVVLVCGGYWMFGNTDVALKVVNLKYWSDTILTGDANSIINNLVPMAKDERNIVKFSANYLINGVRILLPVELLWKSPSRGVIFITYQMWNIFLYMRLRKIVKAQEPSKKLTSDWLVMSYINAFFFASVLFEPDFGSVFRHSMNLLPFSFYILKRMSEEKDSLCEENTEETDGEDTIDQQRVVGQYRRPSNQVYAGTPDRIARS